VTSRLPPEVATRLVTLIVAGGDGEDDEGRAGIAGAGTRVPDEGAGVPDRSTAGVAQG
jgi:hypothetical protein